MFHIIYLSAATQPFTTSDLECLITQSRNNNTSLGITGMLFYRDGNFLQILEGPESEVETLYARICRDPRHGTLIRLFAESIEEREFADWSMAFRDLSPEPDFPEGYNPVLNVSWPGMDNSGFSPKIAAFLKMFTEG